MSESKPFSHFYFSGGIPNYLFLQHVLLSALSLYLKSKSQNQLILSIVLRNLLASFAPVRQRLCQENNLIFVHTKLLKNSSRLSRRWVLTIKAKSLHRGTKQKVFEQKRQPVQQWQVKKQGVQRKGVVVGAFFSCFETKIFFEFNLFCNH